MSACYHFSCVRLYQVLHLYYKFVYIGMKIVYKAALWQIYKCSSCLKIKQEVNYCRSLLIHIKYPIHSSIIISNISWSLTMCRALQLHRFKMFGIGGSPEMALMNLALEDCLVSSADFWEELWIPATYVSWASTFSWELADSRKHCFPFCLISAHGDKGEVWQEVQNFCLRWAAAIFNVPCFSIKCMHLYIQLNTVHPLKKKNEILPFAPA